MNERETKPLTPSPPGLSILDRRAISLTRTPRGPAATGPADLRSQVMDSTDSSGPRELLGLRETVYLDVRFLWLQTIGRSTI